MRERQTRINREPLFFSFRCDSPFVNKSTTEALKKKWININLALTISNRSILHMCWKQRMCCFSNLSAGRVRVRWQTNEGARSGENNRSHIKLCIWNLFRFNFNSLSKFMRTPNISDTFGSKRGIKMDSVICRWPHIVLPCFWSQFFFESVRAIYFSSQCFWFAFFLCMPSDQTKINGYDLVIRVENSTLCTDYLLILSFCVFRCCLHCFKLLRFTISS